MMDICILSINTINIKKYTYDKLKRRMDTSSASYILNNKNL
jgi:hypothetical protein